MTADRAIGLILSCSVGVVLALGTWMLWRAHHAPPPPPPATATPSASPTAVPSPTPTGALPRAARGYRLAGTVIGDVTYAVIESPGGRSELFRVGQIIKPLGQITAIEADRVVIAGQSGAFALRVAAAPTATAAPTSAVPTLPPRAHSGYESSP